MARRKRTSGKKTEGEAGTPTRPGLPLPSPEASTNLVIADIVLRAAGGLLRDRLEKGLITRHHDNDPKAHRLVDKRGVAASAMLWGASHLARRSPIGLAVVAGGLAAKVFYDRGKRLEAQRKAKRRPGGEN
ncbi:hypothetical protein ACLBKU_02385 [Erythrobacter sp. NE805]|uniref:hypothetical protein n=1 Tax=Erythrobacter sp. NE805 TaxID=3389875 RepID=UPI00396B3492